MEITLNGARHEIDGECTVAELVERLGAGGPSVVVEHNGAILERERWGETTVRAGDAVELIRFVGGG